MADRNGIYTIDQSFGTAINKPMKIDGVAVVNGTALVLNGLCPETADWWFVSFADADLPIGTQFLGNAIVQGLTFLDAVSRTNELEINPGGGVKAVEIHHRILAKIPESFRNRLLTRAEADELESILTGAR